MGVLSCIGVVFFYPFTAGERVIWKKGPSCYIILLPNSFHIFVFQNCRWHYYVLFVGIPPDLVPRLSTHCYTQSLQEHRTDAQS